MFFCLFLLCPPLIYSIEREHFPTPTFSVFFFFPPPFFLEVSRCELVSKKMGSFSGLGIGLSFVFGCILLGLVAELYYLLWWKKRISNRDIEDQFTTTTTSYGSSDLSHLFCWKKPKGVVLVSRENSSHGFTTAVAAGNSTDANNGRREQQDLEMGRNTDNSNNGKDLTTKGFGEESVESELMRLHNLCGPPRFLFTIKEETKEDLESEDGKSRSRKGSRTRSLSDLLLAVDNNNTPFLTPLSSPPIKTAAQSLDSYNHHGFNPLFESMSEAELNKLRSSPPPKFKFLRDAEEKLIKRLVLIQEAEKKRALLKNGGNVQDPVINASANPTTTVVTDDKNGSFIAFLAKNKEREVYQQPHHHHHLHSISTPSQVLPLASSPSTFRTLDIKSSMR